MSDAPTSQTTDFQEKSLALLKAVFAYERACTELRRADAACTQPRMQKAGNRHYLAERRMFSAAKDLNRV